MSTWRTRWRWFAPLLRLQAWGLIVLCAAGPFALQTRETIPLQSLAIELVIDRSGSMRADDYQVDGQRVTRLQAVQAAASRFLLAAIPEELLSADLVGLITFAANAEVSCPLTIDHEAVVAELERTGTAVDYREDGTAIGDALALAVAELQSLEDSLAETDRSDSAAEFEQPQKYRANVEREKLSKVAILLTDGQHNAGRLTPAQAARMAEHYAVRIYVIGLENDVAESDAARARLVQEQEQLKELATRTGGSYFTASDHRGLMQMYAAIGQLERLLLLQRYWKTPHHWAVAWFEIGPFVLPPLAVLAFLALVLEVILSNTIFMEIA